MDHYNAICGGKVPISGTSLEMAQMDFKEYYAELEGTNQQYGLTFKTCLIKKKETMRCNNITHVN